MPFWVQNGMDFSLWLSHKMYCDLQQDENYECDNRENRNHCRNGAVAVQRLKFSGVFVHNKCLMVV